MTAAFDPPPPPGEPLARAEELLLDALESAREPGEDLLHELCRAHPELAAELRRVFDELGSVRSILSGFRSASSAGASALPQVAGRFRPLAELGRGGMSVVLAAWDQRLRRKVALKCVLDSSDLTRSSASQLARRRARLLNEAQVLAQLDHPGIVPVYDVVVEGSGDVYVAMLRVRGVDLRRIYQRCWKGEHDWNLARVVGVLQRVCEAVAYAHEKGVLHRDLKPANVMVGAFGEAYVMDWGLARTHLHGAQQAPHSRARPSDSPLSDAPAEGSISLVVTDRDASGSGSSSELYTQEGDVVGTPSYMPPEQAQGAARLDGRADVYALGSMLYELLARRAPYTSARESSSPSQLLAALRAGPPQPLVRAAPHAPAELSAIVERAMARDPRERYASMRELADDLRSFLEGRVVRAHRTGALAELRKWVRRNPTAAAGAALAAAAVLGASALQFANHRRVASMNEQLLARDYRNSVALAAAAIRRGGVREARQLLERTDSKLRRWEWRYLASELDTSSFTLTGHGSRVCGLAISPDERLLAAGDQHGVVTLWDLERREAIARSEPLRGSVVSLTFFDEGRHLAAAVADTTESSIVALNAATLAPSASMPLELPVGARTGVHDLVLSRRGELIAANVAGGMCAWRLGSSLELRKFEGVIPHQTFVSYQPACDRVAVGSLGGDAAVWDCGTGAGLGTLRTEGARVDAAVVTPDGHSLVTGDWRGNLTLWDAASEKRVRAIDTLPRPVYRAQWSHDSLLLVVAAGNSIYLYDARTWSRVAQLNGPDALISTIAVSSRGRWLGASDLGGEVHVWDERALRQRTVHTFPAAVRDGALDPVTDALVLVGERGEVELWDLTTHSLRSSFRHSIGVRDVELAPDSDWLVLTDTAGNAHVLDLHSGASLYIDPGADWRYRDAEALRGPRAMFVSQGTGSVERIDLDSGAREWTSTPLEGGVRHMKLSDDARWLVACNGVGRIALIDVDTGALRSWQVTQERIARAYPDRSVERILFREEVGDTAVFDVARGTLLWKAPLGGSGGGDCAFSIDGERVFATGNGGDLLVLDAESGETIVALPGNDRADKRILVSRDGRRVVTLGLDDEVRIWRADGPR